MGTAAQYYVGRRAEVHRRERATLAFTDFEGIFQDQPMTTQLEQARGLQSAVHPDYHRLSELVVLVEEDFRGNFNEVNGT